MHLDPQDRPPLQPGPLIAALAAHNFRWVLCGSQVLALHGANLAPNDLDVVPDLAPANLARVADCLRDLDAIAAYLDGWGGARGTLDACRAWWPKPANATHLDWLFVTPLGLLDIVIAKADSYASLMEGATQHVTQGILNWACDPRRVFLPWRAGLAPRIWRARASTVTCAGSLA